MGALSDAGAEVEASAGSDADARDARAQQRTWVIGGALLVLSALVGVIARGPLFWMYYGKDWLWVLGALVFIIGIGRAGSITARAGVATTLAIVQVLIAAPPVLWFISGLPTSDDPHVAEDASAMTFMSYYAILFIISLVVVTLIGHARVLPGSWSWAPLWVLFWTPLTLWGSLILSNTAYREGGVFEVVQTALWYGPAAGVAFLGVVGIVLGVRAGRGVPGVRLSANADAPRDR